MAAFEVNFPDDFLSELLEADFDEIAEEALKETAPLLERSMQDSCRRVIEHEGDSELVESITARKPKKTKTDAWIVNVGPTGYSKEKKYHHKVSGREYPVSNALKAIWKEYGIAGQQPAKPFITSAVNSVRDAVMDKMQEVFNRKVGGQ
ncbi:MAG: hypothetical protein NC123_15670 [Butyrivibrio sp.]|nr:hypothetical protein [Acetatifactor muris]MCM1560958.1 hypothetical protein [Butyrivibrio sp.]